MRLIFTLFGLLMMTGCADPKNSSNKKQVLGSSNYNCEIKVITDNIPTLSLESHNDTLPFALINFSSKQGGINESWKIKRLKINHVHYFTFSNHRYNNDETGIYSVKVSEIDISKQPLKAEIQFENENGEIVEFNIDNITVISAVADLDEVVAEN